MLNSEQQKILHNAVNTLASQIIQNGSGDCLAKCIEPLPQVKSLNFVALEQFFAAIIISSRVPQLIKAYWLLLKLAWQASDNVKIELMMKSLSAYPNYDPRRLLNLQQFCNELQQANVPEDSGVLLLQLRSAYLELADVPEATYQAYQTIYLRDNVVPFNLMAHGTEEIKPGEIQVQLEQDLKSWQELYQQLLEYDVLDIVSTSSSECSGNLPQAVEGNQPQPVTVNTSINAAQQILPQNSYGFFKQAATLLGRGQYQAALKNYDQALALTPNSAGLAGRATALLMTDNVAEALQNYNLALNFESENVAIHYGRATALLLEGSYQAALSAYQRALALEPNNAAVLFGYGAALKMLGDYQAALIAYQQALHWEPAKACAHISCGDILALLGRYEEALAAYNSAIKIEQAQAACYLGKGFADMLTTAASEAATAACDHAHRCELIILAAMKGRIQVTLYQNQYAVALTMLNEVLKLYPQDDQLFYLQAYTHYKMANYTPALESLNQALKCNAENAQALLLKAKVHKELLHLEAAVADFEKALKVFPGCLEAETLRRKTLNRLRRDEFETTAPSRQLSY